LACGDTREYNIIILYCRSCISNLFDMKCTGRVYTMSTYSVHCDVWRVGDGVVQVGEHKNNASNRVWCTIYYTAGLKFVKSNESHNPASSVKRD
jgi:hypothetical protein